jgi:ribosomal protein S18 acetylase RimI-like enzyme
MLGVGGWMWERLLEMYVCKTQIMALHVQVGNLAALRFYKKLGFMEREVVREYYRKLEPPDAVFLVKYLELDGTDFNQDIVCSNGSL